MKKRWASMLILCAVILTGCNSGEDVLTESNVQEKQELTIWSYYETESQQRAMDQLVEEFNSAQDVYTIEWEYVPMTEFSKKLSMGYTENALPDLVVMDNPDMPYYMKTGLLADITDMEGELGIREDYYPKLLDTVYNDGKLYGVPLNCNNTALIYHTEILEETGIIPPQDWESFEEAVQKLRTDQRYGFLMSAADGEQGAFQILPWILSTGESIEEIGGEKTARAYDYLYRMIRSGGMDSNCINYSQIDVARKFIQGETAMMQNGPWVLPMLDEAGISYGITPLPVDNIQCAVVGGENIGILRGKNIEGAREFLKFVCQDNVMEQFCRKTGVLPTKKRLRDNVDIHQKVFLEQMDTAVVRTQNPRWNSLSPKLSQGIYAMLADGKTAEEVADTLQEN